MSFYDAIRVGASGAADFEIERSLRFNDDDSAYLNRTPSSAPTSGKKVTFSIWFKICTLGTVRTLFANLGGGNGLIIQVDANDELYIYDFSAATNGWQITSDFKLRDVSAWYHLVVAIDTTQATDSNRAKVYINGELKPLSAWSVGGGAQRYPAQDVTLDFNANGDGLAIGGRVSNGQPWDGYLAEINVIDGQQLTPSSFAETNSDTGQWVPIDTSGLTFGTNGFRLNFSDNSGTTATTLGKDTSGNGNNFTPNNFSVAAGAGNDSLEDTPTNNFCTLNPLAGRGTVFLTPTNGNLDFSLPSGSGHLANASFLIPTSGKWYAEYVFTTVGSGVVNVGNNEKSQGSSAADQLNGISMLSGEIRVNDSSTQTSLTAFGNNDIIGVKVDRDAGTVAFTINGSAVGNAENISSMSEPTDLIFRAYRNASGGNTPVGSINFGQRPFSYQPSGFKALNSQNLPDPTILLPNNHFNTITWSGNNTSGRTLTGVGFSPDWTWLKCRSDAASHQLYDTVRGGNLILYSNKTDAEESSDQYGYLSAFTSDGFTLTNGDNASYPAGSVNMTGRTYVGWNWNGGDTDSATYTVKVVSDSGNKYRFNDFGTSAVTLDLAEGGTYTFDQSDSSMSSHPMQLSTTANGTHGGGSAYSTGVTYELDGSTVTASAFISGFSSASSRKLIITVAASAPTLYYYCYYHSGMGGAVNTNSTLGSSNFAGTIQSKVKANTTAGFSIVRYTGNGTGGATVGHGLGVAPQFIITKQRSTGGHHWRTYHVKIGATKSLYLDLTAAQSGSDAGFMNNTEPTSTVFSLGTDTNLNENGQSHIAYCFSGVAGYSKFGSYIGNGNANGTFVHTGFRPAWVLVKRTDSSENWVLKDTARNTFNDVFSNLNPNNSNAEFGSSGDVNSFDFVSNGFKIRGSNSAVNASGGTFIYLAFAKSPFKNSRAR